MSVYPIGRVHDILRRLEDNTPQPDALKTCFGILAIMSRDETNKLTIARDGMEIILNSLTAHVDKADVQESGCDLLWSLSFNNASVKDLIAKHGGANVLVRALKRHCRSADFLKSACGALSNMCQSKLNQDGVAAQGGLQPLVGSIHAHQGNVRLLPFVFDALASLIVSNEENARTVSSLGIIPLVVTALGRHKTALEVVKSGCHSLAILSDVKGQASKIAFAGGVSTILPLLDAHPSYADLHRVAAVVLLRMLQESTHVSREITCHEGIRILLMSLEKGGAQQDTVAAVTHILYSVTSPSSPSASLIEPQLWLQTPVNVLAAELMESNIRSKFRCMNNSSTPSLPSENGGSSSTNISLDVHQKTLGNRVQMVQPNSLVITNTSNTSSVTGTGDQNGGAAGAPSSLFMLGSGGGNVTVPTTAPTALGGLVKVLMQYVDRKDVVRASCRLLNNLGGFSGVVLALNQLNVLDIVLECVAKHHAETKDVAESASSLLKAINRRVAPSVILGSRLQVHGLLILFQQRMHDEELVIACCDIFSNIVRSVSKGDRNMESIGAYKNADGVLWNISCITMSLQVLQVLMGGLEGSGPGLSSTGKSRGSSTWSKSSVKLLCSLISLFELSIPALKLRECRTAADMYIILSGIKQLLPSRLSDVNRRIELLLPLVNGVIPESMQGSEPSKMLLSSQLTNNASEKASRESASASTSERTSGEPGVAGAADGNKADSKVVTSPTHHGRTQGGKSGKYSSNSSGGTSYAVQPVVWTVDGDACSAALSINNSNYHVDQTQAIAIRSTASAGAGSQQQKRLLPQHPLRNVVTPYTAKLVDTWPNFAERLLPPPVGNRIFLANTMGIGGMDRMHVVYESETAAGKNVVSKCANMMPYEVDFNGLGEPFEHSLTFDSEFESGNLLRAVQRGDANYDLFLRSDLHTVGHTQWFYFAVSNTHPPALVKLSEQGVQVPPVRVRFNIVNLTKPDSLFNLGMKPVMYSSWDAATAGTGWLRTGSDIAYYINPHVRNNNAGEGVSSYYTLSFTMEFHNAKDTYLIAYTYPYTYSDYKVHVKKLIEKPGSHNIMKQFKLCQTLGGLDCDLLVITNFKESQERIGSLTLGGMTEVVREDGHGGAGPQPRGGGPRRSSPSVGNNSIPSHRVALKPALFFTGRVHPGETPASWMMKGMLDFLTGTSPQAQTLRHLFVIFIVPMLNPDGVYFGNNRCSLAGVDLNRQWKNTVKSLHPTIFSIKSLMIAQNKLRDVTMYIDLHGHSRKYNVFMYGSDSKKWTKPQVRAFPKFFASHSIGKKYVCFEDCSFHVKKGRESTARVVVGKELGIPCCFTLEATFCGANYGPLKYCHMNIGHLQEVGAGLCDAILHFCITEGHVSKDMLPSQHVVMLTSNSNNMTANIIPNATTLIDATYGYNGQEFFGVDDTGRNVVGSGSGTPAAGASTSNTSSARISTAEALSNKDVVQRAHALNASASANSIASSNVLTANRAEPPQLTKNSSSSSSRKLKTVKPAGAGSDMGSDDYAEDEVESDISDEEEEIVMAGDSAALASVPSSGPVGAVTTNSTLTSNASASGLPTTERTSPLPTSKSTKSKSTKRASKKGSTSEKSVVGKRKGGSRRAEGCADRGAVAALSEVDDKDVEEDRQDSGSRLSNAGVREGVVVDELEEDSLVVLRNDNSGSFSQAQSGASNPSLPIPPVKINSPTAGGSAALSGGISGNSTNSLGTAEGALPSLLGNNAPSNGGSGSGKQVPQVAAEQGGELYANAGNSGSSSNLHGNQAVLSGDMLIAYSKQQQLVRSGMATLNPSPLRNDRERAASEDQNAAQDSDIIPRQRSVKSFLGDIDSLSAIENNQRVSNSYHSADNSSYALLRPFDNASGGSNASSNSVNNHRRLVPRGSLTGNSSLSATTDSSKSVNASVSSSTNSAGRESVALFDRIPVDSLYLDSNYNNGTMKSSSANGARKLSSAGSMSMGSSTSNSGGPLLPLIAKSSALPSP